MRIILILILAVAAYVVWQAQKHGCKYDATLINCVFKGSGGEQPAAETPAPPAEAPAPAAEAPAPEAPAPEAPAEAPAPAQ